MDLILGEIAPVEKVNALTIFSEKETLEKLLNGIAEKAKNFQADLSTAKGRKEIASQAYKVSQSKTLIDQAGKALVADWKNKAKQVDESRKMARDFLDNLRDEIRKPLTDWETEQELIKAEAEALAKYLADWEEAIRENKLFDRQREIARREAELARIEAERKAREEAERIERERIEREKRIAQEAEDRAKREAEAKIKAAQEAVEQAERNRIAAEERARIEKEIAIKAAEEKARKEAEEKERQRIAKEAAEKSERERIAADREHRENIDSEIISAFLLADITQPEKIINLINSGKIPHIRIEY